MFRSLSSEIQGDGFFVRFFKNFPFSTITKKRSSLTRNVSIGVLPDSGFFGRNSIYYIVFTTGLMKKKSLSCIASIVC